MALPMSSLVTPAAAAAVGKECREGFGGKVGFGARKLVVATSSRISIGCCPGSLAIIVLRM